MSKTPTDQSKAPVKGVPQCLIPLVLKKHLSKNMTDVVNFASGSLATFAAESVMVPLTNILAGRNPFSGLLKQYMATVPLNGYAFMMVEIIRRKIVEKKPEIGKHPVIIGAMVAAIFDALTSVWILPWRNMKTVFRNPGTDFKPYKGLTGTILNMPHLMSWLAGAELVAKYAPKIAKKLPVPIPLRASLLSVAATGAVTINASLAPIRAKVDQRPLDVKKEARNYLTQVMSFVPRGTSKSIMYSLLKAPVRVHLTRLLK